MKRYIGDRFDRQAGSLTSNDCFEAIINATQDAQTAERYREIVSDCEAARYASIEATKESMKMKEVVELIKVIDKKSRK